MYAISFCSGGRRSLRVRHSADGLQLRAPREAHHARRDRLLQGMVAICIV